METVDYCREVETYLCRKNDGHLVRVVGPSFELVSQWAADGVPLTIAFRGIDRYFERYYRKGPRRRPVRIDFCDADVRDLFDEWRRAVGLASAPAQGEERGPAHGDERGGEESAGTRRGASLPAHLERVVRQLTSARVAGTLGEEADALIDRIAADLDAARESPRGLRGDSREKLLARLAAYDRELIELASRVLTPADRDTCSAEAHRELAAFRATMAADAYARSHEAAVARLVRERAGLPTLVFG